MAKQTNKHNLIAALSDIQKRIERGEQMALFAICKSHNLGASTVKKLRYALLEYEYPVAKSDKPLRKMRVKRDKKTWEFIFRHGDGSPKAYTLANDVDVIWDAMEACPKEQANPNYWKKHPIAKDISDDEFRPIVKPKPAKSPLSSATTEQLTEELSSRGYRVILIRK